MLKKVLFILLCIVGLSAFAYLNFTKDFSNSYAKKTAVETITFNDQATIKNTAKKLKVYADTNGYNTDYCFIINMKIASGKKRFFVYNMIKDSIEKTGLVTHGEGSETDNGLVFNNTPNGHATSLGRYKIGNEYYGKFGLAYKLHGLDKTNSKAFERFVVLHGHDCVPANNIYPQEICLSQGCPTVNPQFLKQLKPIINKAVKPLLLQIIYE